uniref:Ig-like domain-containing protein n=1 Tax=Oncorhynchus tshawytscha TaxID=74940 RepID=A0A8C8BU23_ONCTS
MQEDNVNQHTSLSQLLRENYLAEARARHSGMSRSDSSRHLVYAPLKGKAEDSAGQDKPQPQFPDLSAFLSQEELDKSVNLACQAIGHKACEERTEFKAPVTPSVTSTASNTPDTQPDLELKEPLPTHVTFFPERRSFSPLSIPNNVIRIDKQIYQPSQLSIQDNAIRTDRQKYPLSQPSIQDNDTRTDRELYPPSIQDNDTRTDRELYPPSIQDNGMRTDRQTFPPSIIQDITMNNWVAREAFEDFKRSGARGINTPEYGLGTQSKKEFLNKAADFIEELSSLFKANSSKRIWPRSCKTHRSRANKGQVDGSVYSLNADNRERTILLQDFETEMEMERPTNPFSIQPSEVQGLGMDPGFGHAYFPMQDRRTTEEQYDEAESPALVEITPGVYTADPICEPPHFIQKLKSREVLEGSKVQLDCIVRGLPMPEVRWFCEGKELENCPDIQIINNRELHSLTIAEAFEEDTGRYSCFASNFYGTGSTSAEIYVEAPSTQVAFTLVPAQEMSAQLLVQEVSTLDLPPVDTVSVLSLPTPSRVPVTSTPLPTQTVSTTALPLTQVVSSTLPAQVAASELVVLECRVKGVPSPKVDWYREGTVIEDSPDFRILQKKEICTLVIAEVFPEDSGKFTCTASNKYGTVSSIAALRVKGNVTGLQSLDLEVLFLPTSTRPILDDDIRSSQQTLLHDIEKKLRFNEGLMRGHVQQEYKVSNFEQRLMSEIEFRLERTPVEESDDEVQHDEIPTGKCIAPMFGKKLKNFRAMEGVPMTFSCKVVGIPVPKVYWFKDGKQILRKNYHYKKIREGDGTCALHIEVTNNDDDGNYTVLAANPQGRISCSGHLIIQTGPLRNRMTPMIHSQRVRARIQEVEEGEPTQERFFQPHFLQAPGDMVAHEGRVCRLDCKVSGLPNPELMWLINGRPIYPNFYHRMLVRENGIHSLVIDPLKQDDAGTYTCIASNKAGQSSFSLELRVVEKEMKQVPQFVEKLQNTGIAEGTPVRLECRVLGMPPPVIYWKKDNDTIPHTKARVSLHQDATGYVFLLIQPTRKEDAGWYTVSAKNKAGIVSCTARLDIYAQWHQHVPLPMKKAPW